MPTNKMKITNTDAKSSMGYNNNNKKGRNKINYDLNSTVTFQYQIQYRIDIGFLFSRRLEITQQNIEAEIFPQARISIVLVSYIKSKYERQ